jgi:hypothetical protein
MRHTRCPSPLDLLRRDGRHACSGVLAGGTAYAANEWNGSNIQNETLTGADVKNGTLTGQDVFDGTVAGTDITNNSVTRDDVQNGSLTGVDLANLTVRGNNIGFNTIDAGHILDGSLTPEDISEGNLVNFSLLRLHRRARLHDPADRRTQRPGRSSPAHPQRTRDLAWVTGCNTWANAIAPGNVRFNLLVVEAQ